MRILFAEGKQKEFIKEAISLAGGTKQLLKLISTPKSTMNNWIHLGYLIPKNKFDKILYAYPILEEYKKHILETKPDFWGASKGGKKTYKTIIEKYGLEEIRKRQSNGGKKTALKKENNQPKLEIDYNSEDFLEFYGALLGDGWMSSFTNKKYNKTYWQLGLSVHIKNDKDYLLRIREIVKKLFSRDGYLKYKPEHNVMELIFGHKTLIKKLNKELGFPIGLKINLSINERFLDNQYALRHIIRGLFDTDGSIFFDKDKRYKTPYPIIDICTASNPLIEQLSTILKKDNFNVIKYKKGVRIKGHFQVQKWFKEIKPQNKKHILKYQEYITQKYARVA